MTDDWADHKKKYEEELQKDKIKYFQIIEKYKDFFHPTEKEYIEVNSTSELTESSLTSSKILGKPYLPKSQPYPVDNKGVFLQMLAQINLSDLPDFELLPSKGILQFWIAPYQDYGLTDCKFTKVTYYPEVDYNEENLQTDFSFLPVPGEYSLPLDEPYNVFDFPKNEVDNKRDKLFRDAMNIGYPLSFKKKKMFMNLDNLSRKSRSPGKDGYDYIRDNLLDNTYYESVTNGAKIGGYAYSTQRYVCDEINNKKDILLFQIDSCIEAPIMFGDEGVANYYIKAKDLKKLKFKKSWYNWDCT